MESRLFLWLIIPSIYLFRYYASFIDKNQLNIVLELAEAGDMSRMIKVEKFHLKIWSIY